MHCFCKKHASIHDSHMYPSDKDENREDKTSTVWLCSHCHKAFDSKKKGRSHSLQFFSLVIFNFFNFFYLLTAFLLYVHNGSSHGIDTQVDTQVDTQICPQVCTTPCAERPYVAANMPSVQVSTTETRNSFKAAPRGQ